MSAVLPSSCSTSFTRLSRPSEMGQCCSSAPNLHPIPAQQPDSTSEVVVERVTHISADITEKIRKRHMNKNVQVW